MRHHSILTISLTFFSHFGCRNDQVNQLIEQATSADHQNAAKYLDDFTSVYCNNNGPLIKPWNDLMSKTPGPLP